jgi:hypothetical protein
MVGVSLFQIKDDDSVKYVDWALVSVTVRVPRAVADLRTYFFVFFTNPLNTFF